MDHTQIQPIGVGPLSTLIHMLTCVRMIALHNSVRAFGDLAFQRVQEITRYTYQSFNEKPELIEKFISLCSDNLTFVHDWDNDAILASTMQLCGKKVSAKDVSKPFVDRFKRQVDK